MADKVRGPASGIILILFLVMAVGAAALGFLGLQKEKERNAQLTEDITQLEVKKRSAEQEAESLKSQIGDLKRQIEQHQAMIKESNSKAASLNDALSVEKKAGEDALLEVEKLQGEVTSLRNTKSKLEVDLKASDEKVVFLKGKLDLFESNQQKLKAEQSAIPEAAPKAEAPDVQLKKIVVSTAESAPAGAPVKAAAADTAAPSVPAPLEGKVLVVNEEYDFIVISLGKNDNIAVGDMVEILRQDKKIADAKIEEVRDTMSVAMPLEQGMIKNIKQEDRALVS